MLVAKTEFTPAQRAHTRRVLWLLLAYAIVVPPIAWLLMTRPVSHFAAVTLAIVASLPSLGMIASWGRYLSDETDEYHQSLALRRVAVATNATMGAAVVWGTLQALGLMPLVPAYWFPLLWVLMQGFSAVIAILSRGRHGA